MAIAATEAEVQCTDGSRLKGSLLEIGTESARLNADFLAAPVPLKLDHILEIGLAASRGTFNGDHIATVTLSNGDILRGELTGVTDKIISLNTWYAGEMKFRREMVDTLDIQDRPEVLYSGPTGLEGWHQEDPQTWTFEQGSLRAQGPGTISRNVEGIPAKARFAFDLSWRSTPRFRFLFCSDDIEANDPANCYILAFTNARYVQLSKRSARSGNSQIGNFVNIPEMLSKEKIRLELLVDRKTGLIRLLVNGEVAADWTDPEPDAGRPAGGIHFNSQDSSPIRLSRVEVTSWDGVVEGNAPEHDENFMEDDDTPQPKDEPEPDPARIRLRNNDQVAGEMLGIEGGKVKLKTRFGEVNLPVSRLRTFTLHTKEARKNPELYQIPKRYNGDVRAWFPDGACITFRLASVADGRFKGFAQAVGDLDFDASAFNRVEFNLYDPELESARNNRDAW
jgi:hypothetical protein